jgi:SAM-dependent methyltransferase
MCAGRAALWATIAGFPHYRCTDCRHLFVSPPPSEQELEKFYQDSSFYDAALDQRERVVRDFEHRLDVLEQFSNGGMPRTLLDVGCAAGLFLERAKRRGWTAEGVERSGDLAAAAAARSGAAVHRGRLEDAPDASFGAVVSWEVIEHVADARTFFRHLAGRVEAGGILALSTPLSTGIPARVMGTRFPMLCPPEHLRLFSRASLRRLAEEHGLAEIHYESFSNLDRESLASGFHRLGMGSALSRFAAGSLGWAPALVDRLGWGSEMVVAFRKPAA